MIEWGCSVKEATARRVGYDSSWTRSISFVFTTLLDDRPFGIGERLEKGGLGSLETIDGINKWINKYLNA